MPRFIAASAATNLGDGIAVVAWAWVATLLTRDALLVALIPVALRLPWFLFAVPAGIITDRVSRKRLIIMMDALRAVAFAVAALALALAIPLEAPPESGVEHVGLFATLACCAVLIGAAEVFRDNAAQTVLPSIVPEAGLERANGLLWSAELTTNALLGPAVGAFLVAAALPLPFALNVLAYGGAVMIVARIEIARRSVPSSRRDWLMELREGYAFLVGAPMLKMLALLTGLFNMFHQMLTMALILHVQENLHAGARTYGAILAIGAVGGILGGLAGGPLALRFGRGRTAQWMLLLSALTFCLVPLMPGPWTLALVLAGFGFFGMIWDSVSVAFRQRMIPDAVLGRVNSLYRLFTWGMMPLGLFLSGWVVRFSEPALGRGTALVLPFWIAAAGVVCLAVVAWRPVGRGFR